MSPIRTGLDRGWIELRQSFAGAGLIGHLFWPVATLAAVFFLRHREVGGFPLGTLVLPGVLGMFVAFGMQLVIQYLTVDREDGTLLRAKATPHGIPGYLVGKLVTVSGTIIAYLIILLVAGALIADGLALDRPRSWLMLAWVLGLGLVATQSIGAILGALVPSPRGASYLSLLVLGLASISGIFYPIAALPHWLQLIAQAFPMYWLGLGMRAALLPDTAAAVELGQSWRHLETAGVLTVWAIAGLVVAPFVLRRMARRETGSLLAARAEAGRRSAL